MSRSGRVELARLPVGREPHHLVVTPDGKEVVVGSTATNELLVLDVKTGERRRVVRDIIDPYHMGRAIFLCHCKYVFFSDYFGLGGASGRPDAGGGICLNNFRWPKCQYPCLYG